MTTTQTPFRSDTCPTCGQAMPDLTPLQQEIRGLLDQRMPRADIAARLRCSMTAVAKEAQRYQGAARRGRPTTIYLPANARNNYTVQGPVQLDEHNTRPGLVWWTMMESPIGMFSIVVRDIDRDGWGLEVQVRSALKPVGLSFKRDPSGKYFIEATPAN